MRLPTTVTCRHPIRPTAWLITGDSRPRADGNLFVTGRRRTSSSVGGQYRSRLIRKMPCGSRLRSCSHADQSAARSMQATSVALRSAGVPALVSPKPNSLPASRTDPWTGRNTKRFSSSTRSAHRRRRARKGCVRLMPHIARSTVPRILTFPVFQAPRSTTVTASPHPPSRDATRSCLLSQ